MDVSIEGETLKLNNMSNVNVVTSKTTNSTTGEIIKKYSSLATQNELSSKADATHTYSMVDISDYEDKLILQDISTMKDNIVDICEQS